jgi:hypothetical protein
MTRVLSPYELPCGLATVAVPTHWKLVEEYRCDVIFECEHGRISLQCMPYDRPDLFASGKFEDLSWDFLPRSDIETMKPRLAQWWTTGCTGKVTLSDREEADDDELFCPRWRQLEVCPPHHVRLLTWQFQPLASADEKVLRDFTDEVHEVVMPQTRFAAELTDLDRIAPSPTLKVVEMEHSVFMRMPPQWKIERKNGKRSRRRVVTEPQLGRWTLWFDWKEMGHGNPPRGNAEVREFLDHAVQVVSENLRDGAKEVKPGRGLDRIVVQHVVGDGLHTTNWKRLSFVELKLFYVQCSFSVIENKADDPDISAIRDLIERELINAVLVPKWFWPQY